MIDTQSKYVVFITKRGRIKKTCLEEYSKLHKRKNGLAAIKIKEGDELANVLIMDEEELVLITKQGISIHIETKSIAPIGRYTIGVMGMKVAPNDEVLIGLPVYNKTDTIAIVTERGFGKRCALSELVLQNRNGKGLSIYDGKDDNITGAAIVNDSDRLLLSSDYNYLCLSATDFPLVGRTARGNILTKGKKVSHMEKLKQR